MNRLFAFFPALTLAVILNTTPAISGDCAGGWEVLPNYNPASGGACRALGLDSNQGTCQQGQQYETLCDDASGGRYRTCQGSKPCRSWATPTRPRPFPIPGPTPGPPSESGGDCTGRWSIIPDYHPSQGSPCRALGLDSNKGTCQQGQQYETLCDDASGGRYRTCPGTSQCSRSPHPYRKPGRAFYNCDGPWKTMSSYQHNQESPCAALGLNTARGTCERGFRFETLCDEASDGRYRTCEGSRKCR